VVNDRSISETDRLVKNRGEMPDPGVENPVHLVASHCKPWRDSTNEERLNGENGLLLTPSIDHLFDRGFIGFENSGALIIHQSRVVPHFNGWVSTPQKPSTWGSSLAAKSSFLISTGTRCSSNYPRLVLGGALRCAIVQTKSNIRLASPMTIGGWGH
jgi:hypothetical protein